jgi:hypothetical protein
MGHKEVQLMGMENSIIGSNVVMDAICWDIVCGKRIIIAHKNLDEARIITKSIVAEFKVKMPATADNKNYVAFPNKAIAWSRSTGGVDAFRGMSVDKLYMFDSGDVAERKMKVMVLTTWPDGMLIKVVTDE